ncbi:Outer membrane protein TolC [Mucilaginibacter gossypiicola]|uniref:Outer membrane protein TolC n=1 Tax=Mucilaginibacter gossypiicola TaxID=551995 RepID=A0A1H8F7C9_9SPHI|nr:TolC family protein [Mucilaginibacter gossypiicola]SEN27067.1 Outer membrane protein TolC [Mucilaginibacter gossypiicola]
MMIKKITCLVFGFAMVSTIALAQQDAPLLTLKDAVEIALKNNYNIKLSQNNSTIASNNVTLGNAGVLPQLTGNFSDNNSRQSTKQTLSTGKDNNINAHNSNNSYGVNLNWTIFDGFNMFATYDQLKQLDKLGVLRLQDTVQRTVANVVNTYYDLISQNEQIKALKGAIGISHTQLRIATDKFNVGRASRLDVLNAQVNLNTDTGNLIIQYQLFKSTKIQLNQLLIRDLQSDFSVADTIVVDDKLTLADVLNNAQLQNPGILSAQINQRLAEINLKQVRSTRYPQVGVTSGYVFTNSKTPAGFTVSQNVHGFNYGLTASINIFDGFNQNRREKNAKIQIDNAGIAAKQTKLNIESQINSLFVAYLSGLDLVKLEEANVNLNKKNLDITLDKYKLGNITPLEVREAQRNYLDAQSKFFAAQYQSKQAEIMLKQITNSINIQ